MIDYKLPKKFVKRLSADESVLDLGKEVNLVKTKALGEHRKNVLKLFVLPSALS